MRTARFICTSYSMTCLAAYAWPLMPFSLSLQPRLRTDKRGDFRVTPRPCSLRSQGFFKWSRFKRYIFIKPNSIKTNCF